MVSTATVTVRTSAAGGAATHATTITPSKNWIIGRSHEADIVIDDSLVSRQHLVVERTQGNWMIRDVSTNGSWHAGARISRERLAVPSGGGLRVNLGNPAGPEVIITSDDPAVAGSAAPAAPQRYPTAPVPQYYPPAQAPQHYPPAPPPYGAGPPAKPAGPAGPAGPTGRTARITRRQRRIGIAVLVVLLVFVVGDRIAARLAATQAVSRVVQQSQGLASRPTVSFGGFPFLTQVAFGKYTDIKVGMDDLVVDGAPRIEHISGHLKGARIPLSKAIQGKIKTIPVDHIAATVVLRFSDLNAFLKNQPGHLVLAASGDKLQITGTFELLGQATTVSGTGRVGADEGGLVVSPTDLRVDGTGDPLGGVDLGGDGSFFPPVPVPLPDLPFHLRLTAVHVGSNGLDASAAADGIVLDAEQK